MLEELRREGFEPVPLFGPIALARVHPPYRNLFTYRSQQLVCNVTWAVWWSADGGKITAIMGDYGATCL